MSESEIVFAEKAVMRAPEKVVRISKTSVDALRPESKRYKVWDDDLKGFGVRVEPSGRKTYVARYRPGGGRRGVLRELTIGPHGALTPYQARERAKKALAFVQMGGDPGAERNARRKAPTVAELADFYLNDYARSARLRESTVQQARDVLTRFVVPDIGRVKVADVTAADVRRVHSAALEASGKYQANRTLSMFRSALSRAVENGWRSDNPAKGIKPYPEDQREGELTEPQVASLLAALDAYPQQSEADAIRLLLFTGARKNEVLGADWSQFDLNKGIWTKPSAHTKQKRTHRVELGSHALELLKAKRKADPFGKWLFPGADPTKHRCDLKRPWDWVRKRAGLEGVRLHDLRHTMASFMLNSGASLATVGKVLGHTQPATTARYARLLEGTQRVAVEQAGDAMVAAAKRSKEVQVLALPERGAK